MAFNKNNTPTITNVSNSRETANLLPQYYQTPSNKKFLQSTLDQLTQPGTVKNISGFIGRVTAKATNSEDIFLQATDADRQSYQLEPAAVIKDYLGNTVFFKDYIDHINHIRVADGIVNNHSRLNKQEFYSWTPHIDWDKFVNFRHYYWMPYGPDAIDVHSIGGVDAFNITDTILGNTTVVVTTSRNQRIELSNGMKLKFSKNVTPEHFRNSTWYVEGVGSAIILVDSLTLDASSAFVSAQTILFDDLPFDKEAFSEGSFFNQHDYITINRASVDNNAWSRYNRWFHEDVIKISAEANNRTADLDQASRAVRPIIEFEPNIALFNFGTVAKASVDVIDNYTTDVFGSINNSTGFIVDGVELADNMRLLVTADSNPEVNNKIYQVKFVDRTPVSEQIAFNEFKVDNNYIVLETEHKLETGVSVRYSAEYNPIVDSNKTYYVNVIDPYTFELHLNKSFTKHAAILNVSHGGRHTLSIIKASRREITLIETTDSVSTNGDCVTVKYGSVDSIVLTAYNQLDEKTTTVVKGNRGISYWFDGSKWNVSQTKIAANVAPRFDLFDSNSTSLSDQITYTASTFEGTKLFSYKVGSGKIDSFLKFPLSYKNINNVGDIVFNFNLSTTTITYKQDNTVVYMPLSAGYLKINNSLQNGWTVADAPSVQRVVRVFKNSGLTNRFPVDVFDDVSNLNDLDVQVYLNGIRLSYSEYSIEKDNVRAYVNLSKPVDLTTIVTLKCYSAQAKNESGYYEIPLSLQNNPLNESVGEFTLGQVVDHVDSIISNVSAKFTNYQGVFPGSSNLRDLGPVSQYGTKLVQHSCPLSLVLYHLGSKEANILKAIEKAAADYNKFKRSFIIESTKSGADLEVKLHVDYILQEIAKNKSTANAYYLSDMFGYTAANKISIPVIDNRIKTYPISKSFGLDEPSNKAVNVYLNSVQLTHGRDFEFKNSEFFEILIDLNVSDLIEIYEYESTDGCYCPPTPAKLGIMPAYEPKIYIDTTFIEPTKVIQGHDGSVTVAFNDYRDDLILELERRIFNNIKTKYNPKIFNIWNYIPGYNRNTSYLLEEYNRVLSKFFFQWMQLVPSNYSQHTDYSSINSFTWNYRNSYLADNTEVPASWRGIYRWLFDTTELHIKPWECLGFSLEPRWWSEVYGPAPYTSHNTNMWNDIANGVIADPNNTYTDSTLAKPILHISIPVDSSGQLLSPDDAGLVTNPYVRSNDGYFVFGDEHTVEAAWRRSSYYQFAVLQTLLILHPCEVIGKCFDRSRIVRNIAGQLSYTKFNDRISLANIQLPTTAASSATSRTYASGLITYVVDYLTSERADRVSKYAADLKALTVNISSKIGGFTSKEKYKLVLDSKNPNSSSGGVFIPQENYTIDLNTSSAIKKVNYSGVIVTKYADGFEIRGYNLNNPYFEYYLYSAVDRYIQVGGISETYSEWEISRQYVAGNLVQYGGDYFRTITSHTSSAKFNTEYFTRIPSLPIVGGRTVILQKNKTTVKKIVYGTKLSTIQDVVSFLQGYGAFLEEQGFVFDRFNPIIEDIDNWETSIKDFVFWTTQGWDVGSAITLSPAASRLTLNTVNAIVDSVIDSFYNYSIYRVDGQALDPQLISVYRNGNQFVLEPSNTVHGIFGATLYLIQKEHVLVLDDTTLFNDTVYDKPAGYRQEKVKAVGYVTAEWNGGFDIPGFIYDSASINYWEPWTDFYLGDIVKHKEFYYSAKTFLPGSATFDSDHWTLLTRKPEPQLIPNWDYKANQFTDFYDLDTDNFDTEQQKLAQHLTGYQKRQYLENIINNDVSQYKFYQGMISEKGTANSLTKLFDVLSESDNESLSFDEEWAFRVGEYGAVDTFEEVEITLDQSKFKVNPQPIEIVESIPKNTQDLVYRQRIQDIYRSNTASNRIWATAAKASYLRSSGYVQADDVTAVVSTLSDLVSHSIDKFVEGSYVHANFEAAGWNVYRFTKVRNRITNVKYVTQTKELVLEFTSSVYFKENSVIGLSIVSAMSSNASLKGFYVIKSASGNQVIIDLQKTTFEQFDQNSPPIVYEFKSQRVKNIDLADDIIKNIEVGETIWADSSDENRWAVYKHTPCFKSTEVDNINFIGDDPLTRAMCMSAEGNIRAIANSTGINIVNTQIGSETLKLMQRIEFDSAIEESNKLLLAMSSSGNLLVAVNNKLHNNVCIYKFTDGSYSKFLEFSTSSVVNRIAITNSNRIFAVSANSAKLYTLDINSGLLLGSKVLPVETIQDADITDNHNYILVSNRNVVSVFQYNIEEDKYDLYQTIQLSGTKNIGYSVSISRTGDYFVVSDPSTDAISENSGSVYLYRKVNDEFVLWQTIISKESQPSEMFGSLVRVTANNMLVVLSANARTTTTTTFDNTYTTFDNRNCVFRRSSNIGKISVYDMYNTAFLFGETINLDKLVNLDFDRVISVSNNTVAVASAVSAVPKSVLFFTRRFSARNWVRVQEEEPRVDISTIKRVFLYNKKTNKIIRHLDVIDPLQGKIAGVAEKEIDYKLYYDPAVYEIGDNSVTIDETASWGSEQVGTVWWDLTTTRFNEYRSKSAAVNSANWNHLIEAASVDVYEWVESAVLPARWDVLSSSAEGAALGYSGVSRYSNSAYCTRRKFDNVTNSLKTTYYFWVKNKINIPDLPNRSLSVASLSQLIADPVRAGYTCLTFLDKNCVSLVNVSALVQESDCVLAVQSWATEAYNTNAHSEWKLLSTTEGSIIPHHLETKWLHSLVGRDHLGQMVPDTSIPEKYRYGIENKPRQSMFVNRVEAVKQYIERVNAAIKPILIADTKNLDILHTVDVPPSDTSGMWDIQVETEGDLFEVKLNEFIPATVSPVIFNGAVVGISIQQAGAGYKLGKPYKFNDANIAISWYGPEIVISGTGSNASVRSILNSRGSVVDYVVIDSGVEYSDRTRAAIRPLTVLVNAEESGNWALFEYNEAFKEWTKTLVQRFNVLKYWKYIDWYREDANEYTKIDVLVNNTHELITSNIEIGQVAKVKNVGSSGWMLLRKYNNLPTVDYTENYQVIGRQNGTLQFSSDLYNTYGSYDNVSLDSQSFDAYPKAELELIFKAVKDYILVDDLKTEYLKLFFSSVRYALHEQLYVDWAMKTSFVKAVHNVGSLRKKVTYSSDNLESFEQYVNEVKPYKTKIREFISSYNAIDTSQSIVTDFDLQPIVTSTREVLPLRVVLNKDAEIETTFDKINTSPWSNWAQTVGFEITSIEVVDGGSGYTSAPEVVFETQFDGIQNQIADGEIARAKAYISNGRVSRIELVNRGSRWVRAPKVNLIGGLSQIGVPARAVAVIGNSTVRTNNIAIKFDRTNKSNFIENIEVKETFTSNGYTTQFPLKWSPLSDLNSHSVIVQYYGSHDFVDMLKTEYKLTTVATTSTTQTLYTGLLSFNSAIPDRSIITISYTKDIRYLSAADRINFYYTPAVGQLGKGFRNNLDTSQLMSGVDYGGVSITGVRLQSAVGWDSGAGSDGSWDSGNSFVDFENPAISDNYDTSIRGGDFAYKTATGIRAEEIILDGDQFVTPVTSHSPEEVVPGHLSDALAIKVYSRPSGGSPSILFKTHIANGSDIDFDIGQISYTSTVIVTVNGFYKTAEVDYVVDFQFMKVIFNKAVEKDNVVVITSFTAGAAQVLDLDYYIADGETLEFITRAPWVSNVRSTVLVNGEIQSYTVFSTNSEYTESITNSWKSKVGIRFAAAPPKGSIVSYIVDQNNVEQGASVLKTESFYSVAGKHEYTLANPIGDTLPLDIHTLVKVNDVFLAPVRSSFITLVSKNNEPVLSYSLSDSNYSNIEYINSNDIQVYLSGNLLSVGVDYTLTVNQHNPVFEINTSTVNLSSGTSYAVNDVVEVVGGRVSGSPTAIKITRVSATGAILNFVVIRNGNYAESPVAPYQLTGGSGSGATLVGEYKLAYDVDKFVINLHKSKFKENERLVVTVASNHDYTIPSQNKLVLTAEYPANSKIEVISFYKHNVLSVERTQVEFDQVASLNASKPQYTTVRSQLGGKFVLDNPVPSGNHVWIIVNGKLLANTVDYVLLPDYRTIELSDNLSSSSAIDIISFNNNIVEDSYGYMQFKDMLNRVYYKRLNAAKSTALASALGQTDTVISVIDGSVLDVPDIRRNVPGIIEINGERIEYFIKENNTLRQLRRGTLGTGVAEYHAAGSRVQCLGSSETIPYIDNFEIDHTISDGATSVISLQNITSVESKDSIEVFVGGYRLKKNPYTMYADKTWPYSNVHSDLHFPEEFQVLNKTSVKLSSIPPAGVKITVVKKTGSLWNDVNNGVAKRLSNSVNQIAQFITSVDADWSSIK